MVETVPMNQDVTTALGGKGAFDLFYDLTAIVERVKRDAPKSRRLAQLADTLAALTEAAFLDESKRSLDKWQQLAKGRKHLSIASSHPTEIAKRIRRDLIVWAGRTQPSRLEAARWLAQYLTTYRFKVSGKAVYMTPIGRQKLVRWEDRGEPFTSDATVAVTAAFRAAGHAGELFAAERVSRNRARVSRRKKSKT